MTSPPPSPPPPMFIGSGHYPLKDVEEPHAHDVLCGRGGGTNNHIGNNHWRALVGANKQLYMTLPKRQKMLLSRSIVNAIRSQQPPGRFLIKDKTTNLWYDVGDNKATEKTSQALRENNTKKSSNTEPPSTTETSASSESKEENNSQSQSKPSVTPKTALVPPYQPSGEANNVPPPAPLSSPGIMNFSPGQYMAMEMYAGMMQSPGAMSPGMMQQSPFMGMPPIPQHVPSQAPGAACSGGSGKKTGGRKRLSQEEKTKFAKEAEEQQAKAKRGSETQQQQQQHQKRYNNPSMPPPLPPGARVDFETMASMVQPLEPTGISFGSISMTSVEHNRLQPTGTSFGSASMTSAGRGVAPVDGGLEPSGLSHGSQFSINSAEHNYIQNVILEPTPLREDNNAPLSFQTQTFLEQQKSRGNLLECSDTESEDEEDDAQDAMDKEEEWKKMQATLQQFQGQNGSKASKMAPPPKATAGDADGPAEPDFARDISAMSGISLMSLEPYTTKGSLGMTIPPELNQEVSVAFSEMSLSRDVSLENPLAAAEQREKQQQDEVPKDDDGLTEEEKLQKLFLARGGSLAFEPFGKSERGSA